MSKITIYTLAEKLNMTPSMVSRAFNPKARISAEKRRAVLAEAEKCGFTPNRHASRLSMRTVSIGIIISCRFQVNIDKMLLGIRQAHERLKDYKIHYDLTLLRDDVNGLGDYRAAVEKYKSADGVIVMGMSGERYAPYLAELCDAVPAVAQVQSINNLVKTTFSSKHDERIAAELAAEFLCNCLRGRPECGVLMFTGRQGNPLHASAKNAFLSLAVALGVSVLEVIDMDDREDKLGSALPSIFDEHQGKIGGIYITSGFSLPLCRYLHEHKLDIPLVTSDIYDEIREYMKLGVVSATISQDVASQMRIAFERLVGHIINGEEVPDVVYTDTQIIMRSNMHQFD